MAEAKKTPRGQERARILLNLAGALQARYDRTGDGGDLDQAVQFLQEALAQTPPDAPYRPAFLLNLGTTLQVRYEATGDSGDLDGARSAYEQAARSGHPDVGPRATQSLQMLLRRQGFRTETSEANKPDEHDKPAGVGPEGADGPRRLPDEQATGPERAAPGQRPGPNRQEETAPTLSDNPAVVDELERESLAKVLSARIRSMRDAEEASGRGTQFPRGRSFLLHIQGPWGAGKTSLLNFLREELHNPQPRLDHGPKPTPWVVVSFNAWQHQRIAPPWWWLMNTVYHQGFHELWHIGRRRDAILFRLREWTWRARGGWIGYIAALAALVLLILIWRSRLLAPLTTSKASSYETTKSIVVGIVAILTPIVTIWGVFRSASRWLLTKSARGAQAFIDNTRDPMQIVKEHFAQLADWAYPLAILIDDLDRCKSAYVVELLEGIQTLFRDVPVTYVVAADRQWLSDCYKAEYGGFVGFVEEPGRPLGYLFLDKTLQLSAILPTIPPGMRSDFWARLVDRAPSIDRDELSQARDDAAGKFAETTTEEEVWKAWEAFDKDPDSTPAQRRATLEAVAIQLSTPALQKQTEHALRPFAPLLDSNPRAMKRLVNSYGIVRDIETLNKGSLGDRSAQQRTALWVILQLRWPILAEHLKRHPEDLRAFQEFMPDAAPADAPADLQALFMDPEVRRVVRGEAEGIEVQLDSDYVNNHAVS